MIKIILAVDENGAIGKDNDMLYYIKDDLANFKELTTGNTIIMGRNTWESLPIRPLPNRENVVLTRSDITLDGCKILRSMKELKDFIKNQEEDIYIIGGASVYNQVIDEDIVDEVHITFIKDFVSDADTFVDVDKIREKFTNEEYVTTFRQDGIDADYVILRR